MLHYLVVALLSAFTIPGTAADASEAPYPSLSGVEAQIRAARREATAGNPCLENRALGGIL